jgi:hypothetical protein
VTYQGAEPGLSGHVNESISDPKEDTMPLPRLEALLAPYAPSQAVADRALELRVKLHIERALGR